jgi:chloramphenicol-sensitive protein RarD
MVSELQKRTTEEANNRLGFLAALSAYLIWGMFPVYYHQLATISAVEVLCHRIVWSALLCLILLAARGKLGELKAAVTDRRTLMRLIASGICISINWGGYIWAITQGRALDASMAYYVLPLVMLALGVLLLGEKIGPRQGLAIAVMVAGVALLAVDRGEVPWIVVILPVSFGLYALVRKLVVVDAMVGVTVEALLLAPFAAAYLLTRPDGGALVTGDWTVKSLLILCGPVTTVPLVLFSYGARRLAMSTIGLMQYVNPTMQALLAVLLLRESLSQLQSVTFGLIWLGLAIYSLPIRGAERAS